MPHMLAAVLLATLTPVTATDIVAMRNETFHHLQFENSLVAVYSVELPVGATMRFHAHPTNHLAVVIDPGTMRNEVDGAEPVVHSPQHGALVYLPAGAPHRQSNVGQTPVRFIAAEVLAHAGDTVTPATAGPAAGCSQVLDNADVRAWRCLLAPGQSIPADTRSYPYLRIALSSVTLKSTSMPGTGHTDTIPAGTAKWHDKASRESISNAGTKPFELIDLEWK